MENTKTANETRTYTPEELESDFVTLRELEELTGKSRTGITKKIQELNLWNDTIIQDRTRFIPVRYLKQITDSFKTGRPIKDEPEPTPQTDCLKLAARMDELQSLMESQSQKLDETMVLLQTILNKLSDTTQLETKDQQIRDLNERLSEAHKLTMQSQINQANSNRGFWYRLTHKSE